ncbi:hypothetical protein BDW42DRAFT_191950 [Aspergillus taichungensis]|uniref:Probable guanine deaminase n=1 Tax=Aspergillus taichungensis TaxID=482145 RepID=A0A2J5I2C1_9EURO|nr:hypothetical protein BDW42DRAFT_191950 [Aspergillus taichungensis]
MSTQTARAFHGTLVHTPQPTHLEVLTNTLIIISPTGVIQSLQPSTPEDTIPSILASHNYTLSTCPLTALSPSEFLLPGFIDTHSHAPQWSQRGTGRGIDLLTWLNKITFPQEARCADTAHATRLFKNCVAGGLKQGITTACYYSSLHIEATTILAQTCLEQGQRALIGRCAMDRHAPDWYVDANPDSAIVATEISIAQIQALDPSGSLVRPAITPRFGISCSDATLQGLGDLAARHRELPIQTHFNESRGEMEFTKELFPQFDTESQLYEVYGLLGPRTILAHAIYPSEFDIGRMQARRCGIAHCPTPNTTMDEFMVAPVREYLRRGMKVGLGTDCGGGFSASMLEVMRWAFMASVARKGRAGGEGINGTREIEEEISVVEGLWMATAGGARVAGLGDKVGYFAEGMEFDAMVVRMARWEDINQGEVDGVMSLVEEGDDMETVVERFVMTGDDRNIRRVFVKGREVKTLD